VPESRPSPDSVVAGGNVLDSRVDMESNGSKYRVEGALPYRGVPLKVHGIGTRVEGTVHSFK
jgi:hypothetical protein